MKRNSSRSIKTSVDTELLDQLLQLMAEHGFDELTYSKGEHRIFLRRDREVNASASHSPATAAHPITSPGLGTFASRAPLTGESFARPGKNVQAGDIVALLAVGSVVTPVTAPFDGTIGRTLVDEGKIVGFGDHLFDFETERNE